MMRRLRVGFGGVSMALLAAMLLTVVSTPVWAEDGEEGEGENPTTTTTTTTTTTWLPTTTTTSTSVTTTTTAPAGSPTTSPSSTSTTVSPPADPSTTTTSTPESATTSTVPKGPATGPSGDGASTNSGTVAPSGADDAGGIEPDEPDVPSAGSATDAGYASRDAGTPDPTLAPWPAVDAGPAISTDRTDLVVSFALVPAEAPIGRDHVDPRERLAVVFLIAVEVLESPVLSALGVGLLMAILVLVGVDRQDPSRFMRLRPASRPRAQKHGHGDQAGHPERDRGGQGVG
jgi:hypothetical protein